jgi:hypothetical protein
MRLTPFLCLSHSSLNELWDETKIKVIALLEAGIQALSILGWSLRYVMFLCFLEMLLFQNNTAVFWVVSWDSLSALGHGEVVTEA